MTIGQRIAILREGRGVSQESLAEALSVSRQSVSKWETSSSKPSIEKIIMLARFFGVTIDELLMGDISTPCKAPDAGEGNRYFGTDGYRGEANVILTSDKAYRVGRFLGWYLAREGFGKRPRVVIGKDTRRSSYNLEYSIVAGLTASGADVYMLHVTTTPSVSYVVRTDGFDAGIMITASHNPYYDNGIKILNRYGEKLDDKTTAGIEAYIDARLDALGLHSDIPLATREDIGAIIDYASGRNRYLGYLISLASHSYRGLKIGIDAANGSAWQLARQLFSSLGATLTVIGDTPSGVNINEGVGSTHIDTLVRLVKENHLDLGFSFDGDCDRCIAVDSTGEVVDGDAIMYILAKRLKSRGMLEGDTVVATVMSNSGLEAAFKSLGITLLRTDVGDRFVYEKIKECDYSLGGEQSGHIIIKKYASTGDGLLTAIMLTEELLDRKTTLKDLREGLVLFPQYSVSVRVLDKALACSDRRVLECLEGIKKKIGERGRILLRKSGTEPKVRIMVECESIEDCRRYADTLLEKMAECGYGEV